MTDKYAVIGNPVAHSKSPLIHAEFARQTGQNILYTAILAPLDGFKKTVLNFRADGGKGVNITLPFKRDAWSLANVHTGYALEAGAVNTIVFKGSDIIGHNTDGIGLIRDIKGNVDFSIEGKRVLLMGAGGATYGVMEPLLREQPEELVVVNRTLEKAVGLVAHFERLQSFAGRGVRALSYDALDGMQFDLVINATSAGLDGTMPPLPPAVFAAGSLAYDMVYGKSMPFLDFARDHGARTADGLGMLVEQAVESFLIWRGVRPQAAPVVAKLRSQG